MAGTFNYQFKEKYQSKTCVVKYWFGKKYFIWKSLHLKQSCDQVFRDLNNKIAKEKMGTLSDEDLFSKVAKYCSRARVTFALVEVLLETEDLNMIIQFDREQLAAATGDDNCLNLSSEQYLPGWLKSATSNKPLQSIISPPATIPTAKAVEIKPEKQKIAPPPKLAPVVTAGFDASEILKRMQALKNGAGGNS